MTKSNKLAIAPASKSVQIVLKNGRRITIKASEKGGISVYGLGRFPVTLYWEQWAVLLGAEVVEGIKKAFKLNKAEIEAKTKDGREAKKATKIAALQAQLKALKS